MADVTAVNIQEVDSLPAMIRMVEQGVGFTALPYSTIAAEVDRGALQARPVNAPHPNRTLVLARPASRAASPAVGVVEEEIRRIVHEGADALRWTPLCPTP